MHQAIVVKFGGAAFQKPEDFLERAELIKELKKDYQDIVVVVSAMANMTKDLLTLATSIHPNPSKREQDLLLSVGERISMTLLAMALDKKGIDAVSFTGSQSGIVTCSSHFDAKIIDVKPYRIVEALDLKKVVIVAGFQGVSREKEVTTLGLGGSDTSAVALGVALGVKKVQFFKDVSGVYLEDPKKKTHQRPFSYMNYDEALSIVRKGAKILHARSVVLAQKNAMPLCVSSFYRKSSFAGTWIYDKEITSKVGPFYEVS